MHAYDEHHQSDDMDYKVNFSAIGFRSPDGTQILYDDLSTEMLYQAAHQSLEQLESDELWEIVRRLVAVAAAKNMYPLYSDIRKAMQDVLSREKTEIIEDTPAFREMVEGTHAMAVDYGKAIGFWCASIQDRRIDLMPNGFQPYRFSVTQLPSVGFMEWQTYAQSGNDREFGGYVLDLKSPFLVSPKRLIEMQMRQYGIAAHKHIDRIQFSLYEQEKSPQPFFECEIPNPLGII